jgi:hypothetical protein
MRGDVAKYLAPYQSQIKQLTDKSSDFKGQPLKTSLRVLVGGQQCKSMSKTKANESPSGESPANDNPMSNVASAGKAIGSSVGHLVGGLFHKKKADDSQDAASAAAPADAAAGQPKQGSPAATAGATPPAPDPFAQYVQMASFSTETVTINTDAIPASRFDIPPEWSKEAAKPTQSVDDYQCPKSS